ncbi:MAG: Rpn family recombination-promoting nuclease/putative transposase [Planctomycetota bacterium]
MHGLALRLGVTDLVYEIHVRDTNLRVFVLIEHRSFRDRGLHDRLVRYSVHLAHGTRRRRSSAVTPVLAVVLYHGPGSLQLGPRLPKALTKLDANAAALIESLQPRLQCLTDQLHGSTEAELMTRNLTPLGLLTHLSLRCLPHCDPAETLAALDRWGPILRAVDTDVGPPIGREAIAKLGWYILHVTKTPVEDVHMALEKNLQRTENTFMSTAEKLRREGLAQGLTQGLTQGRTDTLLRQLNRRFGPVALGVETRLRSATSAELDRWTDRILDCETLEALFADD